MGNKNMFDLKKVAVIFSAYAPKDSHVNNMLGLACAGIKTIVVDNSPDDIIRFDTSMENVFYRKNWNRGGIAGALNLGVQIAKNEGVEYIVFFDQDSEISNENIEILIKSYQELEILDAKLILGAAYYDKNVGRMGGNCKLTKFWYKKVNGFNDEGFADVSMLITAGTCMSVGVFDHIGEYEEGLFIDHVDTEYCLRALSKKVKMILTNRATFDHEVGFKQVRKLLGLIALKPNNQSANRRYYIFRNNILLMFRYGFQYPGFFNLSFARLAHEVITILLYEEMKFQKLKSAGLGVLHAMKSRLGPM